MSDQAQAPAEQAAEPETTVRNAEAVLAQNQELLAEVKKYKTLAKQADGFDFDKARAAIEAQEKAEQDRLTKKGEWDKLKEQLDKRHADELAKATEAHNKLLSDLKRSQLTNVLTEKGVLPDRAKYLVHELDSQVELVSDESGFSLRKIGGIGDAAEFTAMIENIKATSPFFFAASNASGSGATGSQAGANPSAKTMRRSDFEALSPSAQMSFITKDGGSVTE